MTTFIIFLSVQEEESEEGSERGGGGGAGLPHPRPDDGGHRPAGGSPSKPAQKVLPVILGPGRVKLFSRLPASPV